MAEDASTHSRVVRVEFSLTRAEWARFMRWQLLHLRGMRSMVASIVLVLVGSAVVLVAGEPGLAAALLVVSVLWIGVWGWMIATAPRRSWAKRGSEIGVPHILEVSDEGIHAVTTDVESKTGWAVYTRLIEHGGLYLLGTKSRHLFRIVPRRAFASAADEARFREIVEAHMQDTRTASGRVRAR